MVMIIVATSLNAVIGQKGAEKLLWSSKYDMQFFAAETKGSTVVMGHSTFKSLDGPLPQRTNIVLSNKELPGTRDGVIYVDSISSVFEITNDFYVIGGEQIYNMFLPLVDEVVLTTVSLHIEGHNLAYFNIEYLENNFKLINESKVINDIDRISGQEIELIWSRWTRLQDKLH